MNEGAPFLEEEKEDNKQSTKKKQSTMPGKQKLYKINHIQKVLLFLQLKAHCQVSARGIKRMTELKNCAPLSNEKWVGKLSPVRLFSHLP